jgi:hypothetical protein
MTKGAGRASRHLIVAQLHCLRASNSQHRFQISNLQSRPCDHNPISELGTRREILGHQWDICREDFGQRSRPTSLARHAAATPLLTALSPTSRLAARPSHARRGSPTPRHLAGGAVG